MRTGFEVIQAYNTHYVHARRDNMAGSIRAALYIEHTSRSSPTRRRTWSDASRSIDYAHALYISISAYIKILVDPARIVYINIFASRLAMRDIERSCSSSHECLHHEAGKVIYINTPASRSALYQFGLHQSEYKRQAVRLHQATSKIFCRVLHRRHKHRQGLHPRGLPPLSIKTCRRHDLRSPLPPTTKTRRHRRTAVAAAQKPAAAAEPLPPPKNPPPP
jgi:hypothetical protein